MIQVLSFWYSKIVLRFLTDNEKIIYRNLERKILKLEGDKSHLMFNETCYNNDILPIHTNMIWLITTFVTSHHLTYYTVFKIVHLPQILINSLFLESISDMIRLLNNGKHWKKITQLVTGHTCTYLTELKNTA